MKLAEYLKEMAYSGKAKRLVYEIVWDWPDWYWTDIPQKDLISDLRKKYHISDKQAKYILDIRWDFKDKRINMGEFQEFVHNVLQGEEYTGP